MSDFRQRVFGVEVRRLRVSGLKAPYLRNLGLRIPPTAPLGRLHTAGLSVTAEIRVVFRVIVSRFMTPGNAALGVAADGSAEDSRMAEKRRTHQGVDRQE